MNFFDVSVSTNHHFAFAQQKSPELTTVDARLRTFSTSTSTCARIQIMLLRPSNLKGWEMGIVEKQVNPDRCLAKTLQTVSATVFAKIPIFQSLRHLNLQDEVGRLANQLISFDF